MKVLIRRQLGKSGMIRKATTFNLHVRAELTPEEQSLIQKCDAGETVLYSWMIGKKRDIDVSLTVKGLVEGRNIDCDDFVDLLRSEEEVLKGCATFKHLLEKAKKFGQEEVVEF